MSDPIRVAYIDHTARLGGGEIALLNLVSHLDRSRVKPVVILFSEGLLADRLRTVNVETVILPISKSVLETRKDSLGFASLLKVREVWLSMVQAFRLNRLLHKLDVQIVHTNSLKADIIGGLAGRMARKFVVWHVRDRIENDYLPKGVVRLFRWLARVVPHHVIANSAATLTTIRLGDGRSEAQQSVVYSGVVIHDGTLLPKRGLATKGSQAVVGLVGRISPWKGQDVLIRAAAKLREGGLTPTFRIIGSAMFGEAAYEAEIRKLAQDLGVADQFRFEGFRDDIAKEIASLDVLVHTSKLPEPFGQVVVEGMAAYKPVIAARAGGVMEIIEDGVSGLLVSPDDPDALAQALERVISDPDLAERLGTAGRARVESRFTIDRVARDVEDLYELMVGSSRASVPEVQAGV